MTGIIQGTEPAPAIEDTAALIDLAASAPRVDDRNCALSLRLEKLTGGEDLQVQISMMEGTWKEGTGTLAASSRVQHDIDPSGLKVDGRRLHGTLRATIRPAKNDGEPLVITCALEASLDDLEEQPLYVEDQEVRQFWTVMPRSQGAVYALEGEYRSESPEAPPRGRLAGYVFPPVRPGQWNMGRWDDGLGLEFDMGTKRVNWNHVRLAVLPFEKPRDLSACDGLRIHITTSRPREDVKVSVWLREEDGSWYYVKSAVPLVEKSNAAVLEFEDFAEAEWVSPTSHMDEDYVLDLSSVSHLAVGVVNPLGVGRVAFTLASLDVVTFKERPVPAAVVSVSGRTLSVNGHEMVPPGIFGGFAGELPQKYRPGCQRSLYAPRYPHIPQQVYVKFHRDSPMKDWPAVLALLEGEDRTRRRLSAHLSGLLDEEARRRLDRIRPEKHKDSERIPGDLIESLNELLLHEDLYSREAFAEVELDDALEQRLARLEEEDLTDTERMTIHRRLLDAALPDLLVPLPEGRASEHFWIDCHGERKQPADLLLNPHWKQHLYEYGRDMARTARENQYQPHFEFWNEPYLNWAERSRVHLNSRFYRTDLAEEGGAVHIQRSSRLSSYDVLDWPGLLSRLDPTGDEAGSPALQRIREALSRRVRERFAEAGADPDALKRDVLRSLNDMLRSRTLYDPEAWKESGLPPEARDRLDILTGEKPPADELATLNRALIGAALPGLLADDPSLAAPEVVPYFKWVRDGQGGLKVIDTTAFTYWSGRGNGWIYDTMFEPFARGVKDGHPEARVIAGWGFRWHEDHWAAWDLLYKPTIDRHIALLDGIHEHHYQGDTVAMNGSYEVLEAYTVTAHGKWVYAYNTETNDLVDAPARGRVDTPEKARAASQYRKLVYNLRDIVYSVLQSPDKLRSRTMIHWGRSPDATRVCFGLLENLRGRLIETSSSDAGVWCVASVDGTDPRALPRDFDGTLTLVAVVFNDHRKPREVSIELEAPEGTELRRGVVETTVVNKRTFAIDLHRQEAQPSKKRAAFTVTIAGRSAWKVALPLSGKPVPEAQVERKQFFSPDILQKVRPGRPLTTSVQVSGAALEKARRAWLRLVVEDISRGEGRVLVGGVTIPLPKARTADNGNRIVELPLPLDVVKEETGVAFEVAPGNHAGYRVDMTSIVLE